MKKLPTILLLSILSPATFSQLRIMSFESKQHIGDSVRVDGITVFTEHKLKEKSTWVYFGSKPPLQHLTVIVPDADFDNFPGPLKTLFTNRISIVIGKIVLLQKHAVIIAHNFKSFAPAPGQ